MAKQTNAEQITHRWYMRPVFFVGDLERAKFSSIVDAQLYAQYRAPFKTEGGSQLASASMNASARYKIWGDQGNISLRVADPFKLQRFGYRTANGTVLEYSQRYNGARAVYITVTRNFGQALKLRPKADPESPQTGPPTPP